MAHRKLVINSSLVVAVLVLAALGYRTVVGSSTSTAPSARTVSVTQGDVTAAVSASGNVSSAMSLGVSFTDCTGPLTTISVKPGQVVSPGQTLATVDPSKAQTTLNNAQAQLAAIQPADYTGGAAIGDAVLASSASAGPVSVTAAVYLRSPATAGGSSGSQVAADEAALLTAQGTYKADLLATSVINKAVSNAESAVSTDTMAVAKAKRELANAQDPHPPAGTPTPAAAQAALVQAQHQLITDEATLNAAELLLTQTLTFDQQSIIYWQAEVTYDRGQGSAPSTPAPSTPAPSTPAPSTPVAPAPSGGSSSAGGAAKPSGTVSSGGTTGGPTAGKPAAGQTTPGAAATGGGAPSSGAKSSGTVAGGNAAGGSAVGGGSGGSASGAGAGAATPSQTALNNAQQAVAAAQQALADCTLTAPVRGTVITVNGVLGAPPATSAASASSTSTSSGGAKGATGAAGAAGDGSSAGSVASSPSSATSSEGGFITVSDLGQLQIKGAFSESDVSAVAPGSKPLSSSPH